LRKSALGLLVKAGRGALPWVGLMIVSASAAHAMQVAVESVSDKVEFAAPSSRPAEVRSAPPRRVAVRISFVDARGNQQELECTTTADRVTSDSLYVYLDDVRDVESELCESSPA
jgi:hypothetical protein